jgi:flagellar basal body-associated protein FliL
VKTIGLVAGLMVGEAAVVMMLLKATGPKAVQAHVGEVDLKHEPANTTMEVGIVEEKFQNLQTGRVWIWDIAVFVQVKAKNAERVENELQRRNAEIKEGMSQIISRAQHAQLKEPERQTLNRQFTAYLQGVFGTDSDGAPLVERVMIPRCRGFPADF